jgi:hypothetical protein
VAYPIPRLPGRRVPSRGNRGEAADLAGHIIR